MGLRGKLILAALLCVSLLGSVCPALSNPGKEKKEVKFRWAFAVIHSAPTTAQAEPVIPDMVLYSGDKLKVMIELKKKCFVYLIHNNAQGEVEMLFPYAVKQFDSDYQVSRKYYVPKGDAWFQLDNNTGKEIFYLIASDQRLLDVEFIYDKYVAADPSRKADIARQVLAEIDGIRNQYLASSSRADILASNETLQRGFERATGADPTNIGNLASDIAFSNIFSETFVVEHR
jgi:hypothetical protein